MSGKLTRWIVFCRDRRVGSFALIPVGIAAVLLALFALRYWGDSTAARAHLDNIAVPGLQSGDVPAFLGLALGLALGVGGGVALGRRRTGQTTRSGREPPPENTVGDPLTGLFDRPMLERAFAEKCRLLAERDLVLSLLLIDLDHMRSVNEYDGRERGDDVLAHLGGILASAIREGDVAGRLGGDRFLLILISQRYESRGAALSEALLGRIATEPAFRSLAIPISASIGLTRVWKSATEFAKAVGEAELAVRQAKRDGRNRHVDYTPAMGERHDRRRRLLRQTTAALVSDGVTPVYLPTVALANRDIVSIEALARWREDDPSCPRETSVSQIFSDARLGAMISERVLEKAISDAARLRREGYAFGRVSVNVCEGQVADPDFAERVLDRLLINGLPAEMLALELTPRVLLSHHEPEIIRTLETLAAAGVSIALDDFGAGPAALAHLLRYPVDLLKIDRSIVRDVVAEPAAKKIASGIVALARDLGQRAVAEGVETLAIAETMKAMDCDYGQGFFFSRPVSVEQLRPLLRTVPDGRVVSGGA